MKKGKLVAPIVVAVLLGVYYLGIIVLFFCVPEIPLVAKLLLGVVPAALFGVVIYVLWERIKEIRSGEEDDLSKY